MDKEKQTFYRRFRWVGKCSGGWTKLHGDVWYVLTRDFRLRMERRSWAGTFCTGATARKCLPGESLPRVLRQREWPDMKKLKREDVGSVKHLAAMETELFREHMAIVEFLALMQYEDGTPRAPGRLVVETRGAGWALLLKDPDSQLQLKAVGITLDDALDALQVHLGSDNAPWELDPWARPKGPAKGKK